MNLRVRVVRQCHDEWFRRFEPERFSWRVTARRQPIDGIRQCLQFDMKGDMPDGRVVVEFDLIRDLEAKPTFFFDNPEERQPVVDDMIERQPEPFVKGNRLF